MTDVTQILQQDQSGRSVGGGEPAAAGLDELLKLAAAGMAQELPTTSCGPQRWCTKSTSGWWAEANPAGTKTVGTFLQRPPLRCGEFWSMPLVQIARRSAAGQRGSAAKICGAPSPRACRVSDRFSQVRIWTDLPKRLPKRRSLKITPPDEEQNENDWKRKSDEPTQHGLFDFTRSTLRTIGSHTLSSISDVVVLSGDRAMQAPCRFGIVAFFWQKLEITASVRTVSRTG
jgi:hypothetical protein